MWASAWKEREALNPPTHKRAFLALLSVFQRTQREGDEETKTEVKKRAEAITILTELASQWIEVEQLRTFIFPHCAAHVKGKTHLAKSFEKQYRRCQDRGKTVLSLLFIINYRCMRVFLRDLRATWMSHELLSAGWNGLFKCDRCPVHVCSCYYSCLFFHLLLGFGCGKMG